MEVETGAWKDRGGWEEMSIKRWDVQIPGDGSKYPMTRYMAQGLEHIHCQIMKKCCTSTPSMERR